MKKSSLYKFYKLLALSVVLLLWVVAFSPLDSFCADVTENEAIEIADLWYTMEVDSAHLKLTAVEKKERLNKLDEREIYYFVSATDELLDTYPKQGDVLAYKGGKTQGFLGVTFCLLICFKGRGGHE